MIDLAPDTALETSPRRSTRRQLVWAAAVVLLVVSCAGTVAAVHTWRHYSAAPALDCACGLKWAAPDNLHSRESRAGSYSAINVPGDSSRRQAFYVEIENPSSVTQTVLGLANQGPTGYQFKLEASSMSRYGNDRTIDHFDYTTAPVRVPPNGSATLKFSFQTLCMVRGDSLDWDGLDLRVKVGWLTRTEHVDFSRTSFVVIGTKASCRP